MVAKRAQSAPPLSSQKRFRSDRMAASASVPLPSVSTPSAFEQRVEELLNNVLGRISAIEDELSSTTLLERVVDLENDGRKVVEVIRMMPNRAEFQMIQGVVNEWTTRATNEFAALHGDVKALKDAAEMTGTR